MAGERTKSSLLCTAIKIEPPQGDPFLVVELQIACPICGEGTIRIAGHHLRAIRDALIQMIDLHPTLTGEDADVKMIDKMQFGTRGPTDPSRN